MLLLLGCLLGLLPDVTTQCWGSWMRYFRGTSLRHGCCCTILLLGRSCGRGVGWAGLGRSILWQSLSALRSENKTCAMALAVRFLLMRARHHCGLHCGCNGGVWVWEQGQGWLHGCGRVGHAASWGPASKASSQRMGSSARCSAGAPMCHGACEAQVLTCCAPYGFLAHFLLFYSLFCISSHSILTHEKLQLVFMLAI